MSEDYETGYRDGESNREMDIRIAVTHSRTLEELIQKLRDITGCQDMELGDEWGGEPEPIDLLAARVLPARLSAVLTLDDGSSVEIPEGSGVVADGPASSGRITVRVPGSGVPPGRLVAHVMIRSDSPAPDGSEFGAPIIPALLVPPDGWLGVRIGSI